MRCCLLLLICFQLSSCWLIRVYRIRHMNVMDHQKLPSVLIHRSDTSYQFINATNEYAYAELKRTLDSSLFSTNSAAFLVIRNDSIIYENYWNGFTKDDILPSNSMAKSFTGTLVRIAFNEGKIKSLSDPMTNYIPELLKRDRNFSKITIRHLLDMRSGFKFNEGRYDLKDDAIKQGLKRNMRKQLLKTAIAEPPGRFHYQSINTQFLAWIVERATGKKISNYLEEKLWKPLGTEHDATWNIDSRQHQNEFASAGLNATARDFAKLGILYLQKGTWSGQQLLDEEWVNTISSADTMNAYNGYKNQWWSRTNNRTGAFSAIGFLNQYIYVNPRNQVVIVRIGRRWGNSYGVSTRFIYGLGESL